jgi:hypothetical protein
MTASHFPLRLAGTAAAMCSLSMGVSCGPRGLRAQIDTPSAYDRIIKEDGEVAELERLHQKALATPSSADAATEFADCLMAALGRERLAEHRNDIGEPLPLETLLADSQFSLDRAAQSAPEAAARLLLTKGQLLKRAGQLADARAALSAAFEREPSMAVFHAIVDEREPALLPEPASFPSFCERLAPAIEASLAKVQPDAWRTRLDDVITFVEHCGAEKPDGRRTIFGDAKKIPSHSWLPAKYREVYACWISLAGCDGHARERHLPEAFCDKELQRCVQVELR